MAKKKGKESSGNATKTTSKCICDHPFQCECGKRPERPSRGHKWDITSQTWGGKGHKQKGASGQVSSVNKESTVTAVGKTKVEMWQRLPCKLLEEFCQREGRPQPKFKRLPNSKTVSSNVAQSSSNKATYLYRVIVQDAKSAKRGTDHDIILVPNTGVANEEQAKQEAALLALLHLTPSLPHERTLPEPYKTTWLHAVKAAANANTNTHTYTYKRNQPSSTTSASSVLSSKTAATASAKASTNLTTSNSYVSMADKKKQRKEKDKIRTEKIRKHEAIRTANRDHPVFLSAACRKQIESLLRGGNASYLQELLLSAAKEESENQQTNTGTANDDDLMVYVMERLHREGFTTAQAKTSYKQISPTTTARQNVDNEDAWDKVYDECLQWLCIHLNEDQLPEGFDPRGRTLDVVVAPGTTKSSGLSNLTIEEKRSENAALFAEFSNKYGITTKEAPLILNKSSFRKQSIEDVLWSIFCETAGCILKGKVDGSAASAATTVTCTTTPVLDHKEQNLELAKEELETLEAIFPPDEYTLLQSDAGTTTIRIKIQSDCIADTTQTDQAMELEIVYQNYFYPENFPQRVLLIGGWTGALKELGAAVHVQLVKFVTQLSQGDPMIYEIYGHVQTLLHSATDGELAKVSLLPILDINGNRNKHKLAANKETDSKVNANSNNNKMKWNRKETQKSAVASKVRRPRERSFFWSAKPRDAPPAVAFPKIEFSMANARRNLPAAKARDEFLSIMKRADMGGRVVLVTGETGCGKTTQIPQFILEDAPHDVKIVVAQPRRLAATGVAARVASERGEPQAGKASVGYVVRGDVAMCNNTRLMFCTTGVLLRQLQSEGAFEALTHIIVDEVHERHLDTDVLLGILKACLPTNPNLRVVLMSATLDADRFQAYWGKGTPRMHIPGRTFPVEDYTLEDVLSLTGYIPPKNGKKKKQYNNGFQRQKKSSPWDDSEKSDHEDDVEHLDQDVATNTTRFQDTNPRSQNIPPVEELVKRVDESNVDYDLLGQLVRYLINSKGRNDDGSILVFLSGAPEINKALEAIKHITLGLSVQLLPLHGGLQPKDQNLVFRNAAMGCTKVILSTNVAETSITIPDCTIVIDSCREKQSSYDSSNRMPLLVERFASKDSLKQRRGRAGRVRSGTCYKLISRATLSTLPEHGEPEILRCALDQTLLSLLFLGVEHGAGNFLSTLLDPPSTKSIDAAIFSLTKIGAVSSANEDGTISLTPLGMHLAGIPAPPTVGKILVMGSILGCRSAALAMAAGMSVGRSPFLRIDVFQRRGGRRDEDDQDEKQSIEEMKKQKILLERQNLFKIVGSSDHAMLAAAFLRWDASSSGAGERKRFCESLGLNFNGMRDIKQLVRQLDSSLASAGYHPSQEADRNVNSWRIIRACVVAALAPSQIVRVHRPTTKYTETVEGAVEKAGVARELKFFIRGADSEDNSVGNKQEGEVSKYRGYNGVSEERVFVHPSSSTFSVGSYNCPWLVYFDLIRTSKAFLRDATECSAYAMLLFGGKLDVQAAKGVIVIDEWMHLAANARIGALIGGLRGKVEDLLTKKITDPRFDIASTLEMQIIVNLLQTDGLGQ